MSSFWSRARHVTSSCRCTLCNPSKARVPNRVNLNTAPGRRQSSVNDALTLFYGTVMAAALYTDASVKIGKRNRLDKDILTEKMQVQALEESNHKRLRALGLEAIQSLNTEHETIRNGRFQLSMRELELGGASSASIENTLDARLKQLEQSAAGVTSPWIRKRRHETTHHTQQSLKQRRGGTNGILDENKTRQASHDPRRKKSAASVGQDPYQRVRDRRSELRDHVLVPVMAALSEDIQTSHPVGRSVDELWQSRSNPPVSRYWLKRQEVSLTLLIYQLTQYLNSMKTYGTPAKQPVRAGPSHAIRAQSLDDLITEAQSMLQILYRMRDDSRSDLSELQIETCVNLAKRADSDLHRIKVRMATNNAICETFASNSSVKAVLEKLCVILTNMSQPPDVHLFNLIIINLNRLQCGPAAELVWQTMRHCGLTRNELSVAAILRTHTMTGSRDKFIRIARAIDVLDGSGILPWNNHTHLLVKTYPELLSEAHWNDTVFMNANDEIAKRPRKYVRMPRNEDIYNALITGYLNFGDLENAGRELADMIRSGLRPSLDLVIPVLIEALQAKDGQISKLFGASVFKGVFQGVTAELREAVYIMAQLACQPSDLGGDCSPGRTLDQINSFAIENGLIDQPLQAANLQEVSYRQADVIKQRSAVARCLDQTPLDLHFEQSGTFNRTESRTLAMPQFAGRQPANLMEYSAARLIQLHDEFTEQRGDLANFNGDEQKMSTIIETASKWLQYETRHQVNILQTAERRRGKWAERQARQRAKRAHEKQATIEPGVLDQGITGPLTIAEQIASLSLQDAEHSAAAEIRQQSFRSRTGGTPGEDRHNAGKQNVKTTYGRVIFPLPQRTASLKSKSSIESLAEDERGEIDRSTIGTQKWFVEASQIRAYAGGLG